MLNLARQVVLDIDSTSICSDGFTKMNLLGFIVALFHSILELLACIESGYFVDVLTMNYLLAEEAHLFS